MKNVLARYRRFELQILRKRTKHGLKIFHVITSLRNVVKEPSLDLACTDRHLSKTPVGCVRHLHSTFHLKVILRQCLLRDLFHRRLRKMCCFETVKLRIFLQTQIAKEHEVILGPILTILYHLEPRRVFRVRIVVTGPYLPMFPEILPLGSLCFFLTFGSRFALVASGWKQWNTLRRVKR